MTAVNVFMDTAAGYIFSDGLYRPLTAAARGFVGDKVTILGRLHAAVVDRGWAVLGDRLARNADATAESFDDLAATLGERLREALGELTAGGFENPSDAGEEVILFGWSESRDRLECHVAFSLEQDGHAPFKTIAVEPPYIAPGDAELAARLAARGVDINAIAVGQGLILMEEQRAMWPEQVGGFCQLTKVTREWVSTRVICRWPEDRKGARR